MTVFTESFDIGDGRIVTIETGKLARQADGAVLVRMGKAALLATVVSAQKPRPGADFFHFRLIIKKNSPQQDVSPVAFSAAKLASRTTKCLSAA